MGHRTVRKIQTSRPTLEGAGVQLRRAFGFGRSSDFDPFLLLDDFRGDDPAQYRAGFPWHPHRGIETITYLLEGEVEHQDSLGNRGVIAPGAVQWMTAGSGIIHQEMPVGDSRGRMGGFQLWANLPAREKMMDPRYRELNAGDIPEAALAGGGSARVIAGTIGETKGPVTEIVIDPLYADIRLPGGAVFRHPSNPQQTVFCYVYGGSADFAPDPGSTARDGELVLYGEGDELVIQAGEQGARFLLMAGHPLREPVAWYGPIVMNTQAELDIALRELREDTFIKKGRAT